MELQCFDKFEYQVKAFRDTRTADLTNKLNEIGKEGWELVNIANNNIGTILYIFKRKLMCVVTE